ncbi:MAG: septum formation protein Maf [Rhodobacteraceae bacterium]|nr:septum formation protein Maf [Paracoccaceae bacterium]
MAKEIILASGSAIRAELLTRAGLQFSTLPVKVDEQNIRRSLLHEQATPRDIADALAEMKAARAAAKAPNALVIGCDQILAIGKEILSKPTSPEQALAQLHQLNGKTHQLLSAVVVYDNGQPVWRHVGPVRLTMHTMSDDWLSQYVTRNWPGISASPGAYKLEEEGVRLFSAIQGDYFSVLGLPLLPLLSYLAQRGTLST